MRRLFEAIARSFKSWIQKMAKQHEKDYGPAGIGDCCSMMRRQKKKL